MSAPAAVRPQQDAWETTRLEAFSDGVLAIAITLLVLEFHLDDRTVEARGLGHELGGLAGSYAAYATSFIVIAIMWINHHAMFRMIARADPLLMFFNALLLGVIAFLPFPTSVIARYHDGAQGRPAVVLYGGTLVLVALLYNLVWRYASARGFLQPGLDPRALRSIHRRYLAGPVLYGLALVLGLLAWQLALVLWVGLALLFLLPSPSPFLAVDQ